MAIPDKALPPEPITPTIANCEAPEKVSNESRQVCSTENPAATLAAPKAMPYAPTVKETLRESRIVDFGVADTTAFCRTNPKLGTLVR